MATQFPGLIPVPIIDPVSIHINQSIDRLILSLEQRRVQLLTDLRDRREEMRANQVARQEMEREIAETKSFLERQIKHNKLHSLQGRMIRDLEAKMAELQVAAPPPQELRYLCETRDLEEHIARLGEIIQYETPPIPPIPTIPNYAEFEQPIVAVGKFGSAPGEFNWPRGVSIETESGRIYVADINNRRIQIFSETGDYLNEFGHQHLTHPCGILIHLDSIFVTDIYHHAIFLFKLPDFTMIKRVGKKGSGNEQLNCPRQLAISPNRHIYVPNQNNNKIQILSTSLTFQGALRHQTMTTPLDVKFTNNEMFVLSREDNPCIHVFTLSGEKSRSLVTRGEIGMQVKRAYFFCLDGHNNIVVSDTSANVIKIFSPKGDLLHKIGDKESQSAYFNSPHGIAILNENKIVCVCAKYTFCFQIFSA